MVVALLFARAATSWVNRYI